MTRTFKVSALGNIQIGNTVLLTTASMLYITFSQLIKQPEFLCLPQTFKDNGTLKASPEARTKEQSSRSLSQVAWFVSAGHGRTCRVRGPLCRTMRTQSGENTLPESVSLPYRLVQAGPVEAQEAAGLCREQLQGRFTAELPGRPPTPGPQLSLVSHLPTHTRG